MQQRLEEGPREGCQVRSFNVKDYADTKIKLHFSHFKILVSGWTHKTCVCKYVCMYLHVCARVRARVHVCVPVCVRVCMWIYACVRVRVGLYRCVRVRVCTTVCVYVVATALSFFMFKVQPPLSFTRPGTHATDDTGIQRVPPASAVHSCGSKWCFCCCCSNMHDTSLCELFAYCNGYVSLCSGVRHFSVQSRGKVKYASISPCCCAELSCHFVQQQQQQQQ